MTLVAGFRCGPAAVVCADSVEVVGDYRVTVNKIVPQDCGAFQVAYAGSGLSNLVDPLCDRVFSAIKSAKNGTVSTLEPKIQKALTDFYRSALVKHYPAAADQKTVSALLCVRATATGEIGLFQSRGTVLARVQDFALVGWDETLYKLAAQRMYRDDLSITQGILAGLQVIGLAKKTSQYVGGATSVLVASSKGMWLEQPQAVEANEDTIARVTAHLDRLLVSAPDTGISYEAFDQEFARLKGDLLQIRDRAFQDAVRRAVQDAQKTPLIPIPFGSVVFVKNDKVEFARQPLLIKNIVSTLCLGLMTNVIEFDKRLTAKEQRDSLKPPALVSAALRALVERILGVTKLLVDSPNLDPGLIEPGEGIYECIRALRSALSDSELLADFEELFPSTLKKPITQSGELRFATEDGFLTLRFTKDGGLEVLNARGEIVTAMPRPPSE